MTSRETHNTSPRGISHWSSGPDATGASTQSVPPVQTPSVSINMSGHMSPRSPFSPQSRPRRAKVEKQPSLVLSGSVSPVHTLKISTLRGIADANGITGDELAELLGSGPFSPAFASPSLAVGSTTFAAGGPLDDTAVPREQVETSSEETQTVPAAVRSIGCLARPVNVEAPGKRTVAMQTLPTTHAEAAIPDLFISEHLIRKMYDDRTAAMEKDFARRRDQLHDELEESEIRYDKKLANMEGTLREKEQALEERDQQIHREREAAAAKKKQLIDQMKEMGDQIVSSDARVRDLAQQLAQARRVNALQETIIKKRADHEAAGVLSDMEARYGEKKIEPHSKEAAFAAAVKHRAEAELSSMEKNREKLHKELSDLEARKDSIMVQGEVDKLESSLADAASTLSPKAPKKRRSASKKKPSTDFGSRLSKPHGSSTTVKRSTLTAGHGGGTSPASEGDPFTRHRRLSATSDFADDDSTSSSSKLQSHGFSQGSNRSLRHGSAQSHGSFASSSDPLEECHMQQRQWEVYKEAVSQLPPSELVSAMATQQLDFHKTMLDLSDRMCFAVQNYEERSGLSHLRTVEERIRDSLAEASAFYDKQCEQLKEEAVRREEELNSRWEATLAEAEAQLENKGRQLRELRDTVERLKEEAERNAANQTLTMHEAAGLADTISNLHQALLTKPSDTSSHTECASAVCALCREDIIAKELHLQYLFHNGRQRDPTTTTPPLPSSVKASKSSPSHQRDRMPSDGPWQIDPVTGVLLREAPSGVSAQRPHQPSSPPFADVPPEAVMEDRPSLIVCHPHTHKTVAQRSAFVVDRDRDYFTTRNARTGGSGASAITAPRPSGVPVTPTKPALISPRPQSACRASQKVALMSRTESTATNKPVMKR